MATINVPTGFDTVVAGYEFLANLIIATPLNALEAHGTIVPTLDDIDQTLSQFGTWLPKAKNFREMGIELDEYTLGDGTVWTDAGMHKPDEYLPFLKAFRQIVESNEPAENQADSIRSLKLIGDWTDFYSSLTDSYVGDLARRWFVGRLVALPGVGKKTANLLFDAGYFTTEQVLSTPDDVLLGFRGISKGVLAKMRSYTPG
jgi:hypothetical protein